MKPLKQTKLHSKTQQGNCFQTSIASILDLEIEEVPFFIDKGEAWWLYFTNWLKDKGFYTIVFNREMVFEGYYLVLGTSPRDPDINHQVIYKDGVLAHDPHPDNTGVLDIKECMVLVPYDPGKVFDVKYSDFKRDVERTLLGVLSKNGLLDGDIPYPDFIWHGMFELFTHE